MDVQPLVDEDDNISIFMDSSSCNGEPYFHNLTYKTRDFISEMFEEDCLEISKTVDQMLNQLTLVKKISYF